MQLAWALLFILSAADNWPQWRGPTAAGISTEKNVPVEWDAQHNVAWKAALPGLGSSTPIVWDDLVFVTSQIGDGPIEGRARNNFGGPAARRSSGDKVRFAVQAYSAKDGKLLWEYLIDAEGELPNVHLMHNLASPSCVTDGSTIYAWFGTGQLVALDMRGKLVWSRHLGKEYSHFLVLWGHGSSPLLYKDRLILICDHQDLGYLLALDKRTGKQIWKVDRGPQRRTYATPFVITRPEGDQIAINSEERIDVYDAASGALAWSTGERTTATVPTPVLHDGVLYASRGYSSGPYFAVEVGGKVKWEVKTGAPYISSLLYYDGIVYMATENGVATAVDAADGKTLWKQRLGGVFSASPVAADGKVYFLNEDGETIVVEAGRALKVLAHNKLDERMLASPAISNGRIFMRSDDHLFCISAPRSAAGSPPQRKP